MPTIRRTASLAILALVADCAVLRAGALVGPPPAVVAESGRRFTPGEIDVRVGEALTLVNGDARFLHHPYVESDALSLDAGDMEPGARAAIAFPRTGDYSVLCGIHPRMRLTVRVR